MFPGRAGGSPGRTESREAGPRGSPSTASCRTTRHGPSCPPTNVHILSTTEDSFLRQVMDLEALSVLFRLRRVKLLSHDDFLAAAVRRRRGQAQLLGDLPVDV